FRITEHLPHLEWEGIECHGKKHVINVYYLFQTHEHQDYQLAKKAFFVDKDFDPPLAREIRQAVYETPCYSVENFYTTLDCFKAIIKQEFKISEFGDDETLFQQCLHCFATAQHQFHTAIIEFNAWVSIHSNNKTRLNLKEFDSYAGIKKLIKIEHYHVKQNRETFTRLFERNPVDETAIEQVMRSFSDYRCTFRGKQELLFGIYFLNTLKDDLCCSTPSEYFGLKKPRKIAFQIPTANFLSALTQYAHTPAGLRTYLTQFQ
ncbi:MAG: DUF4435 domain-containing protein, partial [Pseudomonadota bacterium]|nr:DUF4435 domain-containing protein [Pseudomonadota bacterium]